MDEDLRRLQAIAKKQRELEGRPDPARDLDPFFTVKDVAAWLGVNKMTVYRWRREGMFPDPMKFGRSLRWSYDDLKEWFKSMRETKSVTV